MQQNCKKFIFFGCAFLVGKKLNEIFPPLSLALWVCRFVSVPGLVKLLPSLGPALDCIALSLPRSLPHLLGFPFPLTKEAAGSDLL